MTATTSVTSTPDVAATDRHSTDVPPGSTRARRRSGVPIELTVLVVVLFASPARFVVPGFGAAGNPSTLIAAGLFALLAIGRLRPQPRRAVTPVAIALVAYFVVAMLSWASGHLRPLPGTTAASADRSLLTLLAMTSLSLFVVDRIRSWAALMRLIDVVLLGSMVMCAVGLVQFTAGVDVSGALRFPGLVQNITGFDSVPIRLGLRRPFGTSLHPIEFGVVCAGLLPVAMWRARFRGPWWAGVAAAVLAFCSLASLSRSAILALGIVLIVVLAVSSWSTRAVIAAGTAGFLLVASLLSPRLLDVIVQLFTGAGSDPSVQARQDRTPEVIRLISEYPWFGRGYGTFTVDEYLLLDNQVQVLAIETGVIGVLCFAASIGAIVWAAINACPDPGSEATTSDPGSAAQRRSLGMALVALIAALTVSTYTFDAFYYRVLSAVLYLAFGMVGVLWHLGTADRAAARAARLRPDASEVSPTRAGRTRVSEPTGSDVAVRGAHQ